MPGWKNTKGDLSARSSQFIRCPFYRAHSEKAILCEGVIPDTKSEQRFEKMSEKAKQQSIFCEGNYEKCEHYIAVKHFRWEDDE